MAPIGIESDSISPLSLFVIKHIRQTPVTPRSTRYSHVKKKRRVAIIVLVLDERRAVQNRFAQNRPRAIRGGVLGGRPHRRLGWAGEIRAAVRDQNRIGDENDQKGSDGNAATRRRERNRGDLRRRRVLGKEIWERTSVHRDAIGRGKLGGFEEGC